jgi:hypothetical protein
MFDHSTSPGRLADLSTDLRDALENDRNHATPALRDGRLGRPRPGQALCRAAGELLASSLSIDERAVTPVSARKAVEGHDRGQAVKQAATAAGSGCLANGIEPAGAVLPLGPGKSAALLLPGAAPAPWPSRDATARPNSLAPEATRPPTGAGHDADDVRFDAADLVRYLVAVNASTYAALQDRCPDALMAIAQLAIDLCAQPGRADGAALRRMLECGVLSVDAMGRPVLNPAAVPPSGPAAPARLSVSIAGHCAQLAPAPSQGSFACHASGAAACGVRGVVRPCAMQAHGLTHQPDR